MSLTFTILRQKTSLFVISQEQNEIKTFMSQFPFITYITRSSMRRSPALKYKCNPPTEDQISTFNDVLSTKFTFALGEDEEAEVKIVQKEVPLSEEDSSIIVDDRIDMLQNILAENDTLKSKLTELYDEKTKLAAELQSIDTKRISELESQVAELQVEVNNSMDTIDDYISRNKKLELQNQKSINEYKKLAGALDILDRQIKSRTR